MYDIFASVFQRYAHKIAIIEESHKITFGDLALQVDLCSQGLAKDTSPVIAIHTQTRVDFIVVMLAAIKLQKAFLPIDAHKTLSSIIEQLRIFNLNRYVCGIDDNGQPVFQRTEHTDQELRIAVPPSVMSFMFTSGSTGKPKCVMVPRLGVINLLHAPTFFNLQADDVFATYSPLSFDASTFEIFTPLLNGNTLVILDKFDVIDSQRLYEKAKQHNINCLWVTAGLFNEQIIAKHFIGLTAIKKLFVGGDKVLFEAAKSYLSTCPDHHLFNGYGPTENTVFASVAELTSEQLTVHQKIPIGKLINGVRGVLLDESGKPVRGSGTGILHLTGKGLSPGYFNNPEATQAGFVELEGYPNTAFYNTGDIVTRNAEGLLFFIGRKDRQVKLNGYRVDLNQLEEKCYQLNIFEHIILYFSAQHSGLACIFKTHHEISRDAAITALKKSLNDYEHPRFFITGTDWPLSENGKLDTKTIIRQAEDHFASNIQVSHSINAHDRKPITQIIGELLKIPEPDKNMNLFDTGFDSITLVRLQAAISEHYDLNISLLDLYEIGTISSLETSLMHSHWTDEQDYYLQQTENTNPGAFAYLADEVPANVKEIFRLARNVVEHHAGINTDKIGFERYPEMEIDKVADIFAILHKNGVRTITQPIALADKVVGNCFNISKVAVSLLRHKGIPARIRYAYCTYFYEDFNHEQALVEYWDATQGRWLRGDASMNEEIMTHLDIKVNIDLLDVSTELSQPIADVWLGCRKGELSFEDYGASVDTRKRGGLGHVAHKLTHDLACLNQLELMACDFIAPPRNYLKSKNLKLEQFDNLAMILKDANYKSIQYNQKQVPFCATPRRILRKSRLTGVNLK